MHFLSSEQIETVLENHVLMDEDIIRPVHLCVQTMLEFGLVVMYSSLVPFVAILVLIHNLWLFRAEMMLMTRVHRRPTAEIVNGHSRWSLLMIAMVLASMFVNVVNILMTSRTVNELIIFFSETDIYDSTTSTPVEGNITNATTATNTTYVRCPNILLSIKNNYEISLFDRILGRMCFYEDIFQPGSMQIVFGMVLAHIFVTIFASIHFCILRRPKWLYLVQKKKDHWNKFYQELSAKGVSNSLADQREAAGHSYNPKPLHVGSTKLRPELEQLARKLAVNSHREWARAKIDKGFTYTSRLDSSRMESSCLKPFHLLSAEIQDLNLAMARETLLAIRTKNYDFASILEDDTGLDESTKQHVLERLDSNPTAGNMSEESMGASVDEAAEIDNYDPQPADLSCIHHIPAKVSGLIEHLAEHAHEAWAQQRMDAGWRYGAERNDSDKHHPLLVHYNFLKEDDRAAEREAVIKVVKMIIYCGYNILSYEDAKNRQAIVNLAKKKEVHAGELHTR